MKKVTALGLVVSVAIALTGCTDSDATPSDQTGGELRQVRVAALPITETAALWGGIAAGVFEKHGLKVEVVPGLTTLTTITTKERTEKDAKLVEDFTAAMKKTLEWAKDPANEASLRQAIKDNLELPPPVAESVRLPAFGWEVDRSSLQTLAELAQKYKVLDKQPNFDRLIQQQ